METTVGERVDVAVAGAGFGGLVAAGVCADAGLDALELGAALATHGPHATAALDLYARARDAKLRRTSHGPSSAARATGPARSCR